MSLSGVKQTCRLGLGMSASDPLRRSRSFARRLCQLATVFTFLEACSINFAILVKLGFMPVDCRLALSFGITEGNMAKKAKKARKAKKTAKKKKK